MNICTYPSIYAIGHKAAADILLGDYTVEEKIDGSQFSAMVDHEGNLHCRSKGALINIDESPKLFAPAVNTMKELIGLLVPNTVYRGEAICKNKHNVLEYGRVPSGGLILYDIDDNLSTFYNREAKEAEAKRLGLEVVPAFDYKITSIDDIKEFIKRESCLGKSEMEGIVIKNYDRFTIDKKVMMAKYVSEAFKERHMKDWKSSNPSSIGIIENIITALRTEARWNKAIQHLRDDGRLLDDPKDIGPLMKELSVDTLKEEAEFIKEKLFEYAWPKVAQGVQKGFAQYYKEQLATNGINGVKKDESE